jgi:hypothetical protein
LGLPRTNRSAQEQDEVRFAGRFSARVDTRLLIGQANNMFPEPKTEKPASTALSIFIAVLVLLLITGGISWFYFNSKTSTPEPVATTTPSTSEPTSETAVTESTITTAPTDIASAISQLDKELLVISQDEQSDDDTIDL